MAMKLAAAVNAAIAMNLAAAETRIGELVREQKLVAHSHCKDYHEEFQGNHSLTHHGTCFFHLKWAMDKGVEAHPDWYPNGTTASVADVQCALYLKEIGEDDGTSHSCDRPPCAMISTSMQNGADTTIDITKCLAPAPTPVPTPVPAPHRSGDFVVTMAPTPSVTTTTEAPGSSSLPTWAIVLLVVAGCACVGGPLAIFGLSKKPKKTRSVKSSLTAPAGEDEDMPQFDAYPVAPTSSTQLPVATPAGYGTPPQYGGAPQYGQYGGAPQYGQFGSYAASPGYGAPGYPAYAQPRPY